MSDKVNVQDLLQAGVHFGHLKSKWNPSMKPYVFMEKDGIHIIDLNKTIKKLEVAANAAKNMAKSGKKILFVATKKQASDIVAEAAKSVNMPYVTERWLGGMLTNFVTVRKSVKKIGTIEKMFSDDTVTNLAKRERLILNREKEKLEKVLGGITDLTRMPSAVFIVDIKKEDIALLEANKLGITSIAMVDTNSDPNLVDFPIPANDDASKSISIVTKVITEAIAEGLAERQILKQEAKAKKEKEQAEKAAEAPQEEE